MGIEANRLDDNHGQWNIWRPPPYSEAASLSCSLFRQQTKFTHKVYLTRILGFSNTYRFSQYAYIFRLMNNKKVPFYELALMVTANFPTKSMD